MKKFKDESYEMMYDLFITQNLSTVELAEMYNTSKENILEILKRRGIKKSRQMSTLANQNYYLKKYGVKNPMQRKEIQDKVKATNIAKYGVDNVYKSKEIKEKIKDTMVERYGVEHAIQSDKIQEKIKDTMVERYGVEHALQSPELLDKAKNTLMENYGVKTPMESDVLKRRLNDNNIKKYGVSSTLAIPEIKSKSHETIMKKYGAWHVTKNKEISNAIYNNTIREYFETHFKGMTIYEISQITNLCLSRVGRIILDHNLQDLIKYDPKTSHYEDDIIEFIKSLGINNIIAGDRTILKPFELDIYLPDHTIAIEFNGTWWHSNKYKPDNYHINKSKAAEALNIRLIHIYEHEWINEMMQEKIKSMLKIALGKTDTKIYARQCEIREISNREAKVFNECNHLQGHRAAEITYGLFYKNELVQLMSFGHNYKLPKDMWEIVRGCPASNNVVVGGVSKLFKHFIKNYNPDKIFSYCDFNKFDGHGYESLGMKFIGYTGPDLSWIIDPSNITVVPRSPKKHKELKEKSNNTYIKGAGSKKYLWTKEVLL